MSNKCNFCEKEKEDVKKLIVGVDAGICDICVPKAMVILEKELNKDSLNIPDVDPIIIKEHLDKHIVSQDEAKIILSVAVSNHCKRINSPEKNIDKSNVILMGPSGSGKTILAKTIANYLDIPYAICDATRLTEAGYTGDDVDSILIQLLQRAGGNMKKAQTGIIFIDEIDKIAKKLTGGAGAEVGGEGVQQSLLKLVEGSVFSIMPNKRTEVLVEIDTSNILFIGSGAFTGMDKIKKRSATQTRIGFSADVSEKQNKKLTDFEDLVEYGMIPEFTGRFPIIAEVEELVEADMIKILNDVENNLVKQFTQLFDYDDIELAFDEEALSQIVQIAMKKKAGARGLRSIMEKSLLPHMYNISNYNKQDINKVHITKNLISNPRKVKMITKLNKKGGV